MRFILGLALAAGLFMFSMPAAQADVINGDFETGNLAPWSTFTTPNGTLGGPTVVLFDTTGGGASNAARFRVGEVSFNNTGAGGGITQNVALNNGFLTIDVDIASFNPNQLTNSSGGLFQLLFNGSVVDTHDFGSIAGGATERSTLSASGPVTAGVYSVGVRMTRPFISTPNTPFQYVDNFRLGGTAVPAVPEPSAIALLGLGGLVVLRRKLRKNA